jgi:ABC-type nitrate/sulfonate/bicarbonate transport system substrate-binding protein
MFKWASRLALCVLGLALGPSGTVGQSQQEAQVTFAIPAFTLTFTAHFVAEDAGFFKHEALKVSTRNLVGVASPNAVLAGSADFTMGTGPVFLRAAAQGQGSLPSPTW